MRDRTKTLLLLLLLTVGGIFVQGYHPGLEDDAFYLAAIKHDLNPALLPHDADFFQVQFQATIFDKLVAAFLRWTHLPLGWGIFLCQFIITFLVLWGCWRIASRCFREEYAQWAAVTMVAALLTLPASGCGLILSDQYLQPRTVATALILAAIVAVLDQQRLLAAVLLLAAFPIHLNMAPFGVSYCIFLAWRPQKSVERNFATAAMALALPLQWLFEPASESWRKAEATRSFYFLSQWQWYEWLGIFGPLMLLWWYRRLAFSRSSTTLARVSERLVYYGVFQLAVALILMLPPRLERLRSLEPMRFLHLIYLLFVLLSGGFLGTYILKKHVVRWLLLFMPLSAGMLYAQLRLYPATAHLELPGVSSHNAWIEAFRWISGNTPVNSYFAVDPRYMELPGEDEHGFRALAERSVLADAVKDPGMVLRVPRLGPRWLRELDAQQGWKSFQRKDFLRLKQQFGVDWVVVPSPGVPGMTCPYNNGTVSVCEVN